jgi:hypothetical protein
MGNVGGYNHLKQLGVGSTIGGQLIVGAIGGTILDCGCGAMGKPATLQRLCSALPLIAAAIAFRPVLNCYIDCRTLRASLHHRSVSRCFLLANACFWLHSPQTQREGPNQSARGRVCAAQLGRSGWRGCRWRVNFIAQHVSYDGTEYKGRVVPITPNELFYCVTKCG